MSDIQCSKLTLKFQKIINISFKNPLLLEEALRHSSFKKGSSLNFNNERLEFLGDAVLKLIVSDFIFKRYPLDDEGVLTRIRSDLVCDKFLCKLALLIDLGSYLMMSYGESKTDGKTRPSNLANGFEALLGAIYLDQGLKKASVFFIDLIDTLDLKFSDIGHADYKSLLQEYTQKHKIDLPVYQTVSEEGPDHMKFFIVEGMITHHEETLTAQAKASNKKDAEQFAAQKLLDQLNL